MKKPTIWILMATLTLLALVLLLAWGFAQNGQQALHQRLEDTRVWARTFLDVKKIQGSLSQGPPVKFHELRREEWPPGIGRDRASVPGIDDHITWPPVVGQSAQSDFVVRTDGCSVWVTFGGGLGHWGIQITKPGIAPLPSDRRVYREKLEDGVILWHER